MPDKTRDDGSTTGSVSREGPRVRPARFFRTLVMCALAAAPPLGCGASGNGAEEPGHGRVYRGGAEGDAGPAEQDAEPEPIPEYGISPPDYAVEPPPQATEYGGPVPAYAAPQPEPTPVVMYGGPGM